MNILFDGIGCGNIYIVQISIVIAKVGTRSGGRPFFVILKVKIALLCNV